jgi:transcriptional regulator with XRE-family HTH domain
VSNDSQSPLGPFIRQQREMQDLSLRRLAKLVGISNPYLSQIERGPRDPSQRVLDAIARNLEISAEALDEHAGFAAARAVEEGQATRSRLTPVNVLVTSRVALACLAATLASQSIRVAPAAFS